MTPPFKPRGALKLVWAGRCGEVTLWLCSSPALNILKAFYFLPLGSLIQEEASSHARSPKAMSCRATRKPKLATKGRKNPSSSYLAMLASPAQAPDVSEKTIKRSSLIQHLVIPSNIESIYSETSLSLNKDEFSLGCAILRCWGASLEMCIECQCLKFRMNELDWRCRPENLEFTHPWFLAPLDMAHSFGSWYSQWVESHTLPGI